MRSATTSSASFCHSLRDPRASFPQFPFPFGVLTPARSLGSTCYPALRRWGTRLKPRATGEPPLCEADHSERAEFELSRPRRPMFLRQHLRMRDAFDPPSPARLADARSVDFPEARLQLLNFWRPSNEHPQSDALASFSDDLATIVERTGASVVALQARRSYPSSGGHLDPVSWSRPPTRFDVKTASLPFTPMARQPPPHWSASTPAPTLQFFGSNPLQGTPARLVMRPA